MENQPDMSFVIPLLNENESLPELYQRISGMMHQAMPKVPYEIIFVNDGSTDGSLETLKALREKDSAVHIISFRKNMGKASALSAGFAKAKGKTIAMLDADLQDGPENIPAMVKKMAEGYDLVVGWKKQRNDPLTKTLPSKLFNFCVRAVSDIRLHDFNSGLKVMDSTVPKELTLYGELHRFIPVLAAQRGFRITEIPVTHYERKYGKSKYGWQRLFKGFFDFLSVWFLERFGHRPLHFFGGFGLTGIAAGVIMGGYLSILHFQGDAIYRRPLLILAVLLIIAGLQMVSIGLIGEMIVSKFSDTQKLPITYDA